MSKKKGTSFEDKKRILLDAFKESADVFNAKEVEKLGEKKGIRGPVIKEVLKGLTDDSLVDIEKVGGSNYYWCFPNKESNVKKIQLETSKQRWVKDRQRLKELQVSVQERLKAEPDATKRVDAEERLSILQSKANKLREELGGYKECDPIFLQQMKDDVDIAKDAIERWTDGVFALKKYAKEKFMMEEEAINQNFRIPADFDYLE